MEKIFIQIASYRDSELKHTINSCLAQAKYPERLTFGICWQYDETTFTDLDSYIPRDGFRIHQVYYSDSKGCCWARHQTNQLYDGEKYTLQIDAHMRFASHWDAILIEMFHSVDSKKPILSTYPAPYEIVNGMDRLHTDRGIQMLKLIRLRRDLTSKHSTILAADTSMPGKSPLLAAGMIFTLGEFCREVEYDPEMYFSGEEISLAARAYTWGYDFYYPNKDVLWHRYKHPMPLHWTDHSAVQKELQNKSNARLQMLLLGGHETLGKYGFGKVRTLSQFEQYAGLNFQERINRKKTPTEFSRKLLLNASEIETRQDYLYWIFSLLDEDDQEIYRYDITSAEVLSKSRSSIEINASLPDRPYRYVLWPFSEERGYMRKLTYDLDDNVSS